MNGILLSHVRDGFEGDVFRDLRPSGQSVRELVHSVPGLPDVFHDHGTVMLNGEPVPRIYWRGETGPELRPRPREAHQDLVTLHFAPQGGSGGKKSLLSLVASIALVAVGAFISGGGLAVALGGSTLFSGGSLSAQALAGAIGFLGRLAIAQLSQPAAKPRDEGQQSQLGSAGADANPLAPMASGTRVCGTLKVFPPMATLPLIELVGDDEIIEAAYFLEGPHALSDIRVDGALASDISDLQLHSLTGTEATRPDILNRYGRQKTPNFELVGHKRKLTGFDNPARTLADQSVPTNSLPKWHTETTRFDPDEIWMQFIWPTGFGKASDTLMIMPMRLRMRPVGSSTWINLPELMWSHNSQLKFSKRVHLIWGAPPAISDAPDEQGAWHSFHTAPLDNRAFSTSGAAWAADPSFVGGIDANQTARVRREYSGFTIWLDPAVFPRGQKWEVGMMRGSLFELNNVVGLGGPFQPTFYGGGLFRFNWYGYTYDGVEYFTPCYTSANYDRFVTETCVLLRFASVWNQLPLPLTSDAVIELKAKNINIGQVSCNASGLVPVWNGTTFAGQAASSNPADHFYYALTGGQTAIPDRLPANMIDVPEIAAWRALCTARDHQIAAAFNGQDWKDVLNSIAGAGRAKLRQAAKWGVVVERNTSAEQPRMMFTPRNANNVTLFKSFDRVPDAFRVSFRDRSQDWENEDRLVLRPGVTLPEATNIIAMDAVGVDRAAQVDDIFARLLNAAWLRDYTISFDTWFESLAAKRGDLVALNHILLSTYHRSGRIVGIETNGAGAATAIRLDNEIAADNDTPYTTGSLACAITLTTGQVKTYALAALDADDPHRLPLVTPITAGEIELDLLVAVGELGQTTERVLIADVVPTSDFEARVTCVPEMPAVNA